MEQEKYISSSTQADRTNRASWFVFSSYFDKERKYLIKTETGLEHITVKLSKKKISRNLKDTVVYSKIINDSIAYIAIEGMVGNVVSEFEKEYYKIKEMPFLIIDLRNNGGGSSMSSERIVKYLIKHKQKASVSGFILKPKENYFRGTLIVLISANTFSAAESFALDLLESGDAILVGTPTGGDTGNKPKDFTTKNGMSFRIPTRKPPQISNKGFPMEGKGIQPHYTVHLTIEDYLEEKDSVLKYVINMIKTMQKEGKKSFNQRNTNSLYRLYNA